MAKNARRRPSRPNDPLTQLNDLAANLWWSWQPDARALFEYANAAAFHAADQNPVVALRKLGAARRRALRADDEFTSAVQRVHARQRRYLRQRGWYAQKSGRKPRGLTAYFCMEYAVHESLPLYAGGLGVLAGDHLKSASDLDLPFCAVGIYWKKGYTRQRIDAAGRQQDRYPTLKPTDTPFVEVTTPAGRPLRLKLNVGPLRVTLRAWRMDVGRIPLYLLDADLPDNAPRDRRLTHVLYSGDRDTRIRQEIILGIGGWRLLNALRLPISCCHLNEGHAAFLSLERIAERIKARGETFKQARRYMAATSVFTTHTPVPAGNEEFDPALVDHYLSGYVRQLKLTPSEFHDLARITPGDTTASYGMTPLALRTAQRANGVAALHGKIARRMWRGIYPGRKVTDVPIGHVTNGIHLRTWLNPRMAELYDGLLGADWDERQDSARTWARCAKLPDATLWELHLELKQRLIAFCRERVKAQLRQTPVRGYRQADAARILDPRALTIGFARRFAPYKRATLVFSDPDRLARILNDRRHPVQLVFSGKAHPADDAGKALIAQVVTWARQARFRQRIVFLEDYTMEVARYMVSGVDVWLNTPERPREASGTSGMKPSLHGGLNLSILDGWWPEGYNRRNGWAIGTGKDHDGTRAADRRDVAALYRLLEKEVVPLYYDRDDAGVPGRWVARMKNAMQSVPPVFNTHRQVKEYLQRYYLPAMRKA